MSQHHRVKLSGRRWRAVKRQAHERDGWRCTVCGKAGALEAHHKIPIEKGGDPYHLDNILSHCRGCHIEHHRRERRQTDAASDRWQRLIAERMGEVA